MEQQSKKALIENFRKHATDSGSVEVQIALLTDHITRLAKHFESNAKDFSSKRGLLKIVNKRRRFLSYLKNNNEEQYKALIQRLGIR